MKVHALIGFAAASFIVGLTTGCGGNPRHAPDAHMNQNAERYTYDYDDGVCTYHYQYDFKTLKDQLQQDGDCRDVPIARYRPQAVITPTYPSPGAAPPMTAPTATAPQAAPSVSVGKPAPATAPRAPAGVAVSPAQ